MKKVIFLFLLLLFLIPSFAFAEGEPVTTVEPEPDPPADTLAPFVYSDLAEGTYETVRQVSLSASELAYIYYTVDGSTPTEESNVFINPILIDKTMTVKFFAVDLAGNKSSVFAVTYTIVEKEPLPDRDGDGVHDAMDLYPDDPTNTPPAYDETSVAGDNKKTQAILMILVGIVLTSLVMGRRIL